MTAHCDPREILAQASASSPVMVSWPIHHLILSTPLFSTNLIVASANAFVSFERGSHSSESRRTFAACASFISWAVADLHTHKTRRSGKMRARARQISVEKLFMPPNRLPHAV